MSSSSVTRLFAGELAFLKPLCSMLNVKQQTDISEPFGQPHITSCSHSPLWLQCLWKICWLCLRSAFYKIMLFYQHNCWICVYKSVTHFDLGLAHLISAGVKTRWPLTHEENLNRSMLLSSSCADCAYTTDGGLKTNGMGWLQDFNMIFVFSRSSISRVVLSLKGLTLG